MQLCYTLSHIVFSIKKFVMEYMHCDTVPKVVHNPPFKVHEMINTVNSLIIHIQTAHTNVFHELSEGLWNQPLLYKQVHVNKGFPCVSNMQNQPHHKLILLTVLMHLT